MKQSFKHRGFSLIELSVSLAIISTILGGGLILSLKYDNKQRVELTHHRMKTVRAAIDAYVDYHGYLPCPSNHEEAVVGVSTRHGFAIYEDGFGIDTDQIADSPQSVITSGAENVRCQTDAPTVGPVPVHALGLPFEYALDGWNRFITYVTNSSGSLDNFHNSFVRGGIDPPDVSFNNAASTPINGQDVPNPSDANNGEFYTLSGQIGNLSINGVDNYMVVLISHGENGFGSLVVDDTDGSDDGQYLPTAGGDFEDDNANWGTDEDYFSFIAIDPNGDPFDDIVYGLTKEQMDGDWYDNWDD